MEHFQNLMMDRLSHPVRTISGVRRRAQRMRAKIHLKLDHRLGRSLFMPSEGGKLQVISYRRHLKVSKSPKRALLGYLPDPVAASLRGEEMYQYSNQGLAQSLPRALNELGYIVDIVSWDDPTVRVAHDYDLFVAHGAINFTQIHEHLGPQCQVIYFSTGSYWKFHNQREEERRGYFYERHHKQLPRDRHIEADEERANRLADGIICLGNQAAATTYAKFPTVHSLESAVYPNPLKATGIERKGSKKSFLFFAGGGNLHKGLDLLLDIFPGLDHELHICTPLDEEFKSYYHKALFKSANIHYHGVVSVRSELFYEITSKCTFVILPSCSEGSPGSVVECMQQGLIPMVTAESHLDVAGCGIILHDYHIPSLSQQILDATAMNPALLGALSKEAYRIAKTRHNPKAFLRKLKLAMTATLKSHHSPPALPHHEMPQ